MGSKGHEAQRELRGTHIGHGVHIRRYTRKRDKDGRLTWAGILLAHRHADGRICEGAVAFDLPVNRDGHTRPRWTVDSFEPLTLRPSIQDPECGLHGHIRSGRWEPA